MSEVISETLAPVESASTDQLAAGNKLKKMAAIGTAAGASVLFAAGCLPQFSEYTGPDDGMTVGVVGDSQIFHAEYADYGKGLDTTGLDPKLTRLLTDNGYRVTSSDYIGAGTDDLQDITGKAPLPAFKVEVIALGANDLHINTANGVTGTPLEQVKLNLDTYLDATPACDVLVKIPETPQWGLNINGPAWNDYLDTVATQRNGVTVNWNEITAEHPEYLGSDGIHASAEGREPFRQAILIGVNACAEIVRITEPTTTTSTTLPEETTTTTLPEETTTTTALPSETTATKSSEPQD